MKIKGSVLNARVGRVGQCPRHLLYWVSTADGESEALKTTNPTTCSWEDLNCYHHKITALVLNSQKAFDRTLLSESNVINWMELSLSYIVQ